MLIFTIPIVLCRVLQTWYSQICAVTDDFYMVSDNIRHNKYKNSRLHKKTNQADRNRAQAHTNTKNNLHIWRQKQKNHNLLPDFVLPYCNYTVKSLASVFSAYIPTQTAIRFKLSDWDRLSTEAFSNRNKQTSSYIKQRGSKLFYRYGTISKMIVLFRKAKERKLYYPWKSFFKYYILTEIPNVSMCFLTLNPRFL